MSATAVRDTGTTGSFVVELTQFSGPLDLLLSLIRDEQLDIRDIPIARIAEQFLARIASLALDEAAEYLEMAAHLLILEESTHELGARILPRFVVLVPRQEHPRLDTQQLRRHLEVLRGLIEGERRDGREELLGDARDRDVANVELLVADEREQEVERSGELGQLDDERAVSGRTGRRSKPRHRGSHSA